MLVTCRSRVAQPHVAKQAAHVLSTRCPCAAMCRSHAALCSCGSNMQPMCCPCTAHMLHVCYPRAARMLPMCCPRAGRILPICCQRAALLSRHLRLKHQCGVYHDDAPACRAKTQLAACSLPPRKADPASLTCSHRTTRERVPYSPHACPRGERRVPQWRNKMPWV
jgi:hypothetical protein